ncbi:MAG: hypothetical protein LBF40_09535 [Deltaproteobacteria bacterium]|jgi:hypothetical protein|nr:hypothetical protein [Deltaproteobacteria bacterium]
MVDASGNIGNRPNGRGSLRGILWLMLADFAISLAGGCFFTMENDFLKEGQLEGGPDLTGTWSSPAVEDGAGFTVSKTEFGNSFAVKEESEWTFLATIERLEGDLFIVQLRAKGMEQDDGYKAYLILGGLTPDRITLYPFKDLSPALRKLAEANGVTITKDEGSDETDLPIAKYGTGQGLIAFFRELAKLPERGEPIVLTKK